MELLRQTQTLDRRVSARPIEEARASRRVAVGDWPLAGVLCLVAVGLPLLAALVTGSFHLPQNDDWAYRFSALQFARTGHLTFAGWANMTLVGQILWSWPFVKTFGGHGSTGVVISTVVLGVIGVSCAYYVAREVLARRWAALAVLLVVAAPGFAWSTSTFMTDIPAFAAEMACLALGLAGLERRGTARWTLLAAAMAVGIFGFAIREFVLAAPVAVLLCAAAGEAPRRRLGYLLAGVAVLIACWAIYRWTSSISGTSRVTIQPPSLDRLGTVVQAYFELALLVSPAVAFAAWRRIRSGQGWGAPAAIATAALGVVVFSLKSDQLFAGDYLDRLGLMSFLNLGGGRPPLLPSPLWVFLIVVAIVSGGLLAWIGVDAGRSAFARRRPWTPDAPASVVGVFAALLGIGLAGYASAIFPFFDRYLWPLAFALAIVLFRRVPTANGAAAPRSMAAVVAALSAILVLVSAALTVNADTFGVARWRAGEIAVAHGVKPTNVDAGFEWVGAHAGIVQLSIPPHAPPYQQWYDQMRPDFRDCGVVFGSPITDPHLRLVHRQAYDLLGVAGRRWLYVYVSSAPGCRRSTASS